MKTRSQTGNPRGDRTSRFCVVKRILFVMALVGKMVNDNNKNNSCKRNNEKEDNKMHQQDSEKTTDNTRKQKDRKKVTHSGKRQKKIVKPKQTPLLVLFFVFLKESVTCEWQKVLGVNFVGFGAG